MATKEREESKETEDKKDISIKGVSKDIYRRVLNLARDTGKTLGEVTNDAYKTFLATASGARQISKNFVEGATQNMPKYIENIKNLSVDKNDLAEIGHKVAFSNIDTLELAGIDNETFDRYVDSITNVKTLKIDKHLSKAKVLVKCSFVDNITVTQ